MPTVPPSRQMRRLQAKWQSSTGWPKRLEWLEIDNLRGWTGQRVPFNFPIVAVVGENGIGKSTILQAAASIYKSPKDGASWYASDFFPDTAWETVRNAEIRFSIRQGVDSSSILSSVRKPTERWRGNPERPQRRVEYIDLSRIQPISARAGYSNLAKAGLTEASSSLFEDLRLGRFGEIMGRQYELAKIAFANSDDKRQVPVVSVNGNAYSGFHQGAGETTVFELLQTDFDQYSLILIDEIESSLHPRAQRRLIRDLADFCRDKDLQIILTTHSPYILSELPSEARLYVMQSDGTRKIVTGVSPEFAMAKMDDDPHPECDIYVEDIRALTFLREIIATHSRDIFERCQFVPFGAASVGRALGQMVQEKRFPRASCVFLDGDQTESTGCILLPGGDAPEYVVFDGLSRQRWCKLSERLGRDYSTVADACSAAMLQNDAHSWVDTAATRLAHAGETVWQAMCSEWAKNCYEVESARNLIKPIEDALIDMPETTSTPSIIQRRLSLQ